VDGRVTLAGRVGSAGEVLRAIEIAFDNNSVRQVISTLQIAPPTARVERPTLPR
jgi:osmotically-inducible protein OsmY